MPLRLTYFAETASPVEIEGFTPDWAHDKSLAEIERFEVYHGNQKLPMAEMFRVSGDPGDQTLEMEGDVSGVHWIGAHMRTGRVTIHGAAGRHLGSEMHGGEIQVEGDAGDWVGAEMHGGLIHVHGNSGDLVGGAYRGSAKGMTGGTILVDGNGGNEIGHTMRRGMIAIGSSAGDLTGFNMLAGTVVVVGNCGMRAGAGMRRGTICLLGPSPSPLLTSFRVACSSPMNIVAMILRNLRNSGLRVDESRLMTDVELCQGDLISGGEGEIIRLPGKGV
jgi:formylmethanofuran dehydrogenase subunit C